MYCRRSSPLRPRPFARLGTAALVARLRVHAVRPHEAPVGAVEKDLGAGCELARHHAAGIGGVNDNHLIA